MFVADEILAERIVANDQVNVNWAKLVYAGGVGLVSQASEIRYSI
jgi:hypothetical protein